MSSSSASFLSQAVHWDDALAKFAMATGVTVSAYDRSSERFSGPHVSAPLSAVFKTSSHWADGAAFSEFERQLVVDCVRESAPITRKYAGALTVTALPCRSARAGLVGALVYGWVFDHFPDPVECRRLSAMLDMEEAFVWTTARSQVPTSPQKLATCKGLLAALSSAIVDNLLARHEENVLRAQREELMRDLEQERERLAAALEELQSSVRIADEFLASVSHDLRAPLGVILASAQALRLLVDNPTLAPIINRLESNAKIEARLVDDLLDITRIRSGKLRIDLAPLDLRDTLNAVVDGLRDGADKKGLKLRTRALSEMPVIGDATRIQQVFWNLIANAIKFTHEGGEIEVACEREADHAIVTVQDSGKGIPPDFLPRIFDKFAQAHDDTDAAAGGLGLGLAIAKSIVVLHEGAIEASSEGIGKGSLFTVKLPLDVRAAPRAAALRDEDSIDSRPAASRVLAVEEIPRRQPK